MSYVQWSPYVTYLVGNGVSYETIIYLALSVNTNVIPLGNPGVWSPQGTIGGGVTNPLTSNIQSNSFGLTSTNGMSFTVGAPTQPSSAIMTLPPATSFNIAPPGGGPTTPFIATATSINMAGAGNVTAPTVTPSTDNSTKVATTAFVQSAITGGGAVTTITPVTIQTGTTQQVANNVASTATTGFVVLNSTTGENLRMTGNTISSGNVGGGGGGGSINLVAEGTGGIALQAGADGGVSISAGSAGNVTIGGDDITITSDNTLTLSGLTQPIVVLGPTIDAHSADITANSFIKQGGTALEYLMANGSVTTNNNNSRITTLETKTQNINDLTTVAGTTNFTGRIDMNLSVTDDRINIGRLTGNSGQGANSIAIGNQSGNSGQSNNCVAIGNLAGNLGQTALSTALGNQAGQTNQQGQCVAIGNFAGNTSQQNYAVAIGSHSGEGTQASRCVAVGYYAGNSGQLANAVAIGSSAGETTQGANSIMIGYSAGQNNASANSIFLNATGVTSSAPNPAFYVAPIRPYSTQTESGLLQYDAGTKEICYNNSPTVTGLRGAIYHTNQAILNSTCFLTFVNSSGVSGYYDPYFDANTLTYNPNTNIMKVDNLSLNQATNTVTYTPPDALFIQGNACSLRYFNFTMSGNISQFTIGNRNTNGMFKINISGNATLPYTISSSLGSGNKTSFATTTILPNETWVMTINVLNFAGTVSNCISLEKFV